LAIRSTSLRKLASSFLIGTIESMVVCFTFEHYSRREFQRRRRGIFVVHQPKNNKLRQERHIPSLLEFTLQRVRHPHKLKLELQPGMSLLTELKFILIWISDWRCILNH
jgi:hypothetical protein